MPGVAGEESPRVIRQDLVGRHVPLALCHPPFREGKKKKEDVFRITNCSTGQTEALEAATASLSVEAQKRAQKDAQKKAAKAEAAEAKQADKIANSVITIKRIERNKKKFVTAVIGLEAFGLDLKKVRRLLGRQRHRLLTVGIAGG